MIIAVKNGFVNIDHVVKATFFTNRETKKRGLVLRFVNYHETFQDDRDVATLDMALSSIAIADCNSLTGRSFWLPKESE